MKRMAHRQSRVREALDVISFFGIVVLIVFFLSIDNIR